MVDQSVQSAVSAPVVTLGSTLSNHIVVAFQVSGVAGSQVVLAGILSGIEVGVEALEGTAGNNDVSNNGTVSQVQSPLFSSSLEGTAVDVNLAVIAVFRASVDQVSATLRAVIFILEQTAVDGGHATLGPQSHAVAVITQLSVEGTIVNGQVAGLNAQQAIGTIADEVASLDNHVTAGDFDLTTDGAGSVNGNSGDCVIHELAGVDSHLAPSSSDSSVANDVNIATVVGQHIDGGSVAGQGNIFQSQICIVLNQNSVGRTHITADSSFVHDDSAVLNDNGIVLQNLEAVSLGGVGANQSTIHGIGLTVQVNSNALVDDNAVAGSGVNQNDLIAGISLVNSFLQSGEAGIANISDNVLNLDIALSTIEGNGGAGDTDRACQGVVSNDHLTAVNSNSGVCSSLECRHSAVVLSSSCVLVGNVSVVDHNISVGSSNIHNSQTGQIAIVNGNGCAVCTGSNHDSIVLGSCSHVSDCNNCGLLDNVDSTLAISNDGQIFDNDHAVSLDIDSATSGGSQNLAITVQGNGLLDLKDSIQGNVLQQGDGVALASLSISLSQGSIVNAVHTCLTTQHGQFNISSVVATSAVLVSIPTHIVVIGSLSTYFNNIVAQSSAKFHSQSLMDVIALVTLDAINSSVNAVSRSDLCSGDHLSVAVIGSVQIVLTNDVMATRAFLIVSPANLVTGGSLAVLVLVLVALGLDGSLARSATDGALVLVVTSLGAGCILVVDQLIVMLVGSVQIVLTNDVMATRAFLVVSPASLVTGSILAVLSDHVMAQSNAVSLAATSADRLCLTGSSAANVIMNDGLVNGTNTDNYLATLIQFSDTNIGICRIELRRGRHCLIVGKHYTRCFARTIRIGILITGIVFKNQFAVYKHAGILIISVIDNRCAGVLRNGLNTDIQSNALITQSNSQILCVESAVGVSSVCQIQLVVSILNKAPKIRAHPCASFRVGLIHKNVESVQAVTVLICSNVSFHGSDVNRRKLIDNDIRLNNIPVRSKERDIVFIRKDIFAVT